MPRLLQGGYTSDSGTALQWQLALKNSGAANMTSLYAVDSPVVADVTAVATIPWKYVNTNYSFDRREPQMNGGAAQIFDLIQLRRADAYAAMAELLESQFWGAPASSSDKLSLNGINYWMPCASAVDTGGFLAANLSGFSDVAGLDATEAANARWRHFTASYGTYTKTESGAGLADAVTQRMRLAMRKTHFMPPVSLPGYATADNYFIGTTLKVLQRLEEAVEAQNESLGNDIASKDGQVLFRGVKMLWVPQIDSANGGAGYKQADGTAATDPILGVNLGVLKPTFQSGEFMREEAGISSTNQHNVVTAHVDSTLNIKCVDRRRLWALHFQTS